MSLRVNDEFMSLEIDRRVIVTARFSRDAATDGHGAWTFSCHPGRLFTRSQATAALTVAELLEFGYCKDNPLLLALREELQ